MSSRPSLVTLLPIVLKTAIEMIAAQPQDRVGSPDGPEHSRLFETRAYHGLASSFDHTRANKQVLAAKLGIAHPRCISLEVIGLGANLLGHEGIASGGMARSAPTSFSIFPLSSRCFWWTFIQAFCWASWWGYSWRATSHRCWRAWSRSNNLNRVREVFGDQSPDPYGSIPDDHLLLGAAPTSF